MDRRPRLDRLGRRQLLRSGVAVATAGAAGCAGGGLDDGPDGGESGATPAETGTGEGSPGEPTEGPSGGDGRTDSESTDDGLDLREANVVGVEVARSDGSVEFSVTLHHDDDGEDGYADWWQVESLDGERLGRRELLHPHGTRPFTRSATVVVPEGADCVVVRGHDQTHGYGGQAMLVDVGTGATRAVRQGPEPGTFVGGDCP